MDKKRLQEVENLDLWSVSPEVKGISKVYVAVMNTDRVFRIWHNGLGMIYPPILCLAYENAVSNILETSLQICDFIKVVLGNFKDYYAIGTGMSYMDKTEINHFKKTDHYYVFCVCYNSCPIRDLQKVGGKMINLKVASTMFLLVCFLSQKNSLCETWKNVFYFTSNVLFVLQKIKV